MVALPKLKKSLSFLNHQGTIPPLSQFLENQTDLESQKNLALLNKANKTLAEKKYLVWLRCSYAFKERAFSPELLLKSWSLAVEKLLKEEWFKVFNFEDPIVLAMMGKLGSGELNLSSDIDLILFGEPSVKKTKIREFVAACSSSLSVPAGFKVDLDLRPGGKSAPLLSTANQLGVHLWNQSDPWERYSYTRMRIPFGNQDLKNKINEIRDQFCYRKYLRSDFFHHFLQLREEYQVESASGFANLKLGAGGIRDVELFVQTFQLLYGGKNAAYKNLSTFEALRFLIKDGVHVEMFEKLQYAYLILRQAEGELHAFKEQAGFDWALDPHNAMTAEVLSAMEDVRLSVEEFSNSSNNLFGKRGRSYDRASFDTELMLEVPEQDKERARRNLETYFSNKNRMFAYYREAILNQQDMKKAFVDLLVHSDYGCRVLSMRPSLFDLFFLRRSFKTTNEQDLFENLSDVKMVQRILASNHFAKTKDVSVLSKNVSDAYEYTLTQILDPEDGIDILFTGKMATREMGLKSDLDFILIVEDAKSSNVAELNKKARALYKKLSFPTFFGPLVPFDKGGGPMGRASPLVISMSSLEQHLKEKAPAWQLLMYLKHRFLFNSHKKLDYLKAPLKDKDFLNLFDILRERLSLPDRLQDPFKLGRGGLFHTEFVTSALYLKKGLQPRGVANIEEVCAKLSEVYGEKDLFFKVYKNYKELFKARELSFVKSSTVILDSKELRKSNSLILEELSQKFLDQRVGGVKK